VFDVPLNEVTKAQRRDAKAVNFGIIYGISNYGLSKNIKCSPKLAQSYIDKYFETYPEVKEYMNKNVATAREKGYVTTVLGRRRYFKDILSKNFNLRTYAERASMNMPLQGSSADIIKVAMINVYNRLKKEGLKSKLILQVHDELIIDALKVEKDAVVKILVEEMQNAIKTTVPLTVETEIGETWFDAK
jgi:DNA polymerase-1